MKTYLRDLRWGKFNLIEGDMISDIAAYCGEWSDVEVTIFRELTHVKCECDRGRGEYWFTCSASG